MLLTSNPTFFASLNDSITSTFGLPIESGDYEVTKSNLCVYVAEDYRDGFLNNLQAIDENRSDIQNEMRC